MQSEDICCANCGIYTPKSKSIVCNNIACNWSWCIKCVSINEINSTHCMLCGNNSINIPSTLSCVNCFTDINLLEWQKHIALCKKLVHCGECNQLIVKRDINAYGYCSQCTKSEFCNCVYCDNKILQILYNNGNHCPRCSTRQFKQCRMCYIQSIPKFLYHGKYCHRCMEIYTMCTICNNLTYPQNLNSDNICNVCILAYRQCITCHKLTYNKYLNVNNTCNNCVIAMASSLLETFTEDATAADALIAMYNMLQNRRNIESYRTHTNTSNSFEISTANLSDIKSNNSQHMLQLAQVVNNDTESISVELDSEQFKYCCCGKKYKTISYYNKHIIKCKKYKTNK